MQISGFQPLTLSDYPGKTAAIVFTQGCNMACPFCHNGQLIPCRRGDLDGEQILRTLEKRKHVLQGVVISGGEPTIQKNLKAFCQKIHNMGMLVKLDTNGSRPKIIEQLIEEKQIDYIAMDMKAPPKNQQKHQQLTGCQIDHNLIMQSMQLIAQSGIEHHFRTTAVPHLLSETHVQEIQQAIPKNSLHLLQKFIPDHAYAMKQD